MLGARKRPAPSSGEVLMLSNKGSLSFVPAALRGETRVPGSRRIHRLLAALAVLGAAIGLGPAGGCGRTDVSEPALRESTDDCGNQVCAPDENCTSCAPDCGVCAGCGDGTCASGETCGSCDIDCGACDTCGNGACDGGETCG